MSVYHKSRRAAAAQIGPSGIVLVKSADSKPQATALRIAASVRMPY
jgi:hypothetical protein